MEIKPPIDLGHRIHLIDGFDLGVPERTGTYVVQEEKLTLIETCASPSIPYILEGLKQLDISLEEIKYIIVTHIHLDHAGGAGLLMQKCPNAKLVVHPKGAKHLADPSRLIQGARAVYGDQFDELFDPIVPVPEEKLIVKGDEETLEIGEHCTLTFYNTPGHANHHFSIFDPVSNGIFTGDTVGIQYKQVEKFGFQLFLPTTTPNQFDPEKMTRSMKKIKDMNVSRIYFGHFGMTKNVQEVYRQLGEWIPFFAETGEQVMKEGKGIDDISARLLSSISEKLDTHHVPSNHPVYEIIKMDLKVCAMGIADYLQKKQKAEAK